MFLRNLITLKLVFVKLRFLFMNSFINLNELSLLPSSTKTNSLKLILFFLINKIIFESLF